MQLELTEHTHEARCPFCRGKLVGERLWTCPRCGTSLHAGCFEEHGRCTTHGCGTLRGAPPAPVQGALRTWLVVALVVSAIVLAAGLVGLAVTPRKRKAQIGPERRSDELGEAVVVSLPLDRSLGKGAVGPISIPGPFRPVFVGGQLSLRTESFPSALLDPRERRLAYREGDVLAVEDGHILTGRCTAAGSTLRLERDGRVAGEVASPERFRAFALSSESEVVAASETVVEWWYVGVETRLTPRLARLEVKGVSALAVNGARVLAASGSEVHVLGFQRVVATARFDAPVHSVALPSTPWGRVGLVVTSGEHVEVHSLDDDGNASKLAEIHGRATAVAMASTSLVIATSEGDAWFVELASPKAFTQAARLLSHGFRVGAAAISPDAKRVALASLEGKLVRVIELESGRLVSEVLPD